MIQNNVKIGLIYFKENSHWKSCNYILSNLLEAYHQTGFKVEEIPLAENPFGEIELVCQEIAKEDFSHLVFLDHRIHPSILLSKLVQITNKLPSLIVHVYGDFFITSSVWHASEKTLKHFNVSFVCASSAQSDLLKKFLKSSDQDITTIPFPVNNIFTFSQDKRIEERQKRNLSANDFVLCYTGRISLQKNVLDVISSFAFIAGVIPDAKLFIAGPFDDIGIPYLNLSRLPLTMETEFFSLIESLPQEISSKIFYQGELNQEELINLYSSSDAYISYSTHNDEDFGMSPAEALCSGLPLFLSNWGGFRDFKLNCPTQVTLSNVSIKKNAIKPFSNIKQKLLTFVCQKRTENFSENSENAHKYYTISSVSKSLVQLLVEKKTKFNGFNSYFEEISKIPYSELWFRNSENEFNEQYKNLYDCYLNEGEL